MNTLERIEKRLADDVIVKMWNLSGDSFDVPRANWLPHVLSILREELARDEREWISVEEGVGKLHAGNPDALGDEVLLILESMKQEVGV